MKELYNNTILIVDDTPENIDILVNLLKDFNLKVAINGEIALKTAWKDPTPDLILLDIVMPEMNGYEVCRKLRKNDKTRDVPVIFLSTKVLNEEIVKGFEAGGQDYITKPFYARELMERVKTQLELRTQRKILKNMNNVLEERVNERTAQLRSAMEDLDKAHKELQGFDNAKNNFLNMISHEIRTPLNGIVGATSLLNETLGKESELSDFVDLLKSSVDRLESFSTAALIITQIQTNYRLHAKDFDLFECVKQCVEDNNEEAKAKNVEIKINNPDFNTIIEGDQSLICRAITNIIDNAIKYSNQGDIVEVSLENNINSLVLKIIDNGKGFSEQALKNLFKPFGIGEEHYDKNLGLGLRASNCIMKAHDGKIEIEKRETGGTCVSLLFKQN